MKQIDLGSFAIKSLAYPYEYTLYLINYYIIQYIPDEDIKERGIIKGNLIFSTLIKSIKIWMYYAMRNIFVIDGKEEIPFSYVEFVN